MHRLSHVFFLGLLLMTPPAAAQVKPKILIIFDTSGSMLQNSSNQWQQGDGSALCGGQGTQSRIYQLKVALFDVLQGMGAEEVDFALETYPMFVDATRNPLCPLNTACQNSPSCAGHYYTGDALLSELTSYNSCKRSDGNDCRRGCKISTHNPLTQTNGNCGAASNPCSAWYAKLKDEVLHVPFGSPPEAVMAYFDQQEDTDRTAPLADPEIRSGNGWWTPLGKSLFYAHGYFHKEVALAQTDYRKPCERLRVALFTDGLETCNDDASDPFYATTWAGNLNKNIGVVTHTIAIDADSQTLRDIAAAGKGNYYAVSGTTAQLKQRFLEIIAEAQPPSETCNGLDDDCDNKIDEDFPLKGQPCDNGKIGECYRTGVYVCNASGTGVRCNAANATGTTEVCNGKDDDCDGQIDEDLPCPVCVAQPEICNGKDDDCDGKIDEDIPTGSCGVDIGECKAGQLKCVNGKLICEGGTAGTTETCNAKDDDCDGTADGLSEACYPPDTAGCTYDAQTGWDCQGYCKPGTRNCPPDGKGQWTACQGYQGPSQEICDGLDNDCDGTVDEEAECPGGSKCVNGQCTQPCGSGEFVCPKGQICIDDWCIPDPCDAQACEGKGWLCKGGECIDPCLSVTCGKYEECQRGRCVDLSCYNPQNKCPAGQTCIQGTCQADPCAKVSCGPDELCTGGNCIATCASMVCPPDQSCKIVDEKGTRISKCVPDLCAGQRCSTGFSCLEGKCVDDPCLKVSCTKGQVCLEGKCVSDPCETIACPPNYTCDKGQCLFSKKVNTTEVFASGSGGFSCAVTQASPPADPRWPLLLIFGLAFVLLCRQNRKD